MPDVTASFAPADVRLWVSLDVHKLSWLPRVSYRRRCMT